jgi:hypothetical protein
MTYRLVTLAQDAGSSSAEQCRLQRSGSLPAKSDSSSASKLSKGVAKRGRGRTDVRCRDSLLAYSYIGWPFRIGRTFCPA